MPMTTTLLMLALLSLAEGAGAAPLLEKGEKLFREGNVAGALAAFQKVAAESADPEVAKAAGEKAAELSRRDPKKPSKP